MADLDQALAGRIIAVLNTASGSCDAASEGQAQQIFDEVGLTAEIRVVAPGDIGEALKDAVANCDVLVVLGGDGTIGSAASLCGSSGPPLIPLPGGTMNMLPKALYDTADWQAALRATLANPALKTVSGGEAAGNRFYCAAILGAPSLWADAREAVREGDLIEAAKRAVTATRRSLSDSINYQFGEAEGSADAVAVICPLISKDMSHDDTALEAVALDPSSASGLFGLAFHAAFDGWRNDPSVTRAKVKVVDVKAHGQIPVILDGEKIEVERHVRITFLPAAFQAVVPATGAGHGG
jgi:diacylglycerol kinase family enzyme